MAPKGAPATGVEYPVSIFFDETDVKGASIQLASLVRSTLKEAYNNNTEQHYAIDIRVRGLEARPINTC